MRRSRGEGTYPDRHRDDGGVEDASITQLRLARGGFHDTPHWQCHDGYASEQRGRNLSGPSP